MAEEEAKVLENEEKFAKSGKKSKKHTDKKFYFSSNKENNPFN